MHPRPAQQAMSRVSLEERLVIVEDGTGSGKTEAAMVHAERLAGAGLVSGVYFAVPTRSAATELHARISRYLDAVPGLRGTVTRVVPGQIDTDGWQGRRPWHLGGSRQAMMARVGVGTIDQAMLSVMAVRHGWTRAAWLVDRLLVIDEVLPQIRTWRRWSGLWCAGTWTSEATCSAYPQHLASRCGRACCATRPCRRRMRNGSRIR